MLFVLLNQLKPDLISLFIAKFIYGIDIQLYSQQYSLKTIYYELNN